MIRVDALDANGEAVAVNVLMDNRSDSTLIREGLAWRLLLSGQRQTLVVSGVGEEASTHLTAEYLELRLKTSSEQIVSIQYTLDYQISCSDGVGEATQPLEPPGGSASSTQLWWPRRRFDWIGPYGFYYSDWIQILKRRRADLLQDTIRLYFAKRREGQ